MVLPIAGSDPGFLRKTVSTVTSFYYDDFKWKFVKCIAMAGLGVTFARQCKGFDLMPIQS